jgi:hypothetical protein
MNGNGWRFLALGLLSVVMVAFGWLHYDAKSDISINTAVAADAKACNTKQDAEIGHLKETVKKVNRMEEKQSEQSEAIGRIETHLEHLVEAVRKLQK